VRSLSARVSAPPHEARIQDEPSRLDLPRFIISHIFTLAEMSHHAPPGRPGALDLGTTVVQLRMPDEHVAFVGPEARRLESPLSDLSIHVVIERGISSLMAQIEPCENTNGSIR